ncbi:MAG: ankyrin repeat domain-containing protein [Acidimicrobiia bacterium]|nr:ankyrin repeat domain-containing protein [Acidimicrobiia bacterium]
MSIPTDDPRVVAAVEAIRAGDTDRLQRLLQEHLVLAAAALGDDDPGGCGMTRTLLHVVTDWPGHYPNGPAAVRLLVAAGADVNARFTGPHTETRLHWAASSDDVDVLDALLDAGADIEARGAVIGGGTPISDATAFGQWNAARRLLERGATTTFWEAATLGLMDRVEMFFADTPPSADEITAAFWGACHGSQLPMARYLLDRGADLNWVGWNGLTPLDAAERSNADDVIAWLTGRRDESAAHCSSG